MLKTTECTPQYLSDSSVKKTQLAHCSFFRAEVLAYPNEKATTFYAVIPDPTQTTANVCIQPHGILHFVKI